MSFDNDSNAIRLQLLRRLGNTNEPDYQFNHFARLAPRMAILLRDYARARELDSGNINVDDTSPNNRRTRWWIHDEPVESSKCTSGIEFLPLAITFEATGKTIYVSYNGGNVDFSQVHQTNGDERGE
jgi:hypothetical protein